MSWQVVGNSSCSWIQCAFATHCNDDKLIAIGNNYESFASFCQSSRHCMAGNHLVTYDSSYELAVPNISTSFPAQNAENW